MRETLLEADWGVRHYWLVWARPEEVLAARECFEEWVLVGALRSAPAPLLALGHHASPERRTLAIQRRRPRGGSRHALVDCLQGIREAPHPQLRLVWLLLLVEGHPQAAGRELIRILRTDPKAEVRAACAMGLSLLGRDPLLDLEEAFQHASPPVRDLICQTLWHLGPKARGCQDWLASYDSNWSRAVLYRLESEGWQVLMQRRVWPLWIDRHSLAALADLAFSLQPDDRLYALRALAGWGPELPDAEGLLKALVRDPDADVSQAAAALASHLGWSEARPHSRDELAALLSVPRSASSSPLPSLARQRELLQAFAYLEAEEQLEFLKELAAHGIPDPKSAEKVWEVLEFPHTTPWRLAALNAYLRVGRKPRRLGELLSDSNLTMRQAAAEVVVQEGHPEFLLASLDRVEIQRAFSRGPHILRALTEWPPDKFAELEQRLRQLELDKALAPLELSAVQWTRFDNFTPTQHQVAAALVRYHKRLPGELVQEVIEGKLSSPGLLELWQEFPPERHYCRGLAQLLLRSPSSGRNSAREALKGQGKLGALALADLFTEADASLADQAVRELIAWPQSRSWAQATWLERCPHDRVRALLRNWLGE